MLRMHKKRRISSLNVFSGESHVGIHAAFTVYELLLNSHESKTIRNGVRSVTWDAPDDAAKFVVGCNNAARRTHIRATAIGVV